MKPPVPIREAVAKMRAYNPPLEGRTKKLRLDFNENPIGCSPKVRQALARLSGAEICSYPEQETVRRQMAKHFGVRPGRTASHQRHRRSAACNRQHLRRTWRWRVVS